MDVGIGYWQDGRVVWFCFGGVCACWPSDQKKSTSGKRYAFAIALAGTASEDNHHTFSYGELIFLIIKVWRTYSSHASTLFAKGPIRKLCDDFDHALFKQNKCIENSMCSYTHCTLPPFRNHSWPKARQVHLPQRNIAPAAENKLSNALRSWIILAEKTKGTPFSAAAHILVKQRISLEGVGTFWNLKLPITPCAVLALGLAVSEQALVGRIELDERIGNILVIRSGDVTRGDSGLRFFLYRSLRFYFYRRGGLLSVGAGRRNRQNRLILTVFSLNSLILFPPLFWCWRGGFANALAKASRLRLDGSRARLVTWPGNAFRFRP